MPCTHSARARPPARRRRRRRHFPHREEWHDGDMACQLRSDERTYCTSIGVIRVVWRVCCVRIFENFARARVPKKTSTVVNDSRRLISVLGVRCCVCMCVRLRVVVTQRARTNEDLPRTY